MPAVLETNALCKRFGKVDALRNCDVALPAGKVTGLVGPNGAGKTTLLQLALGLARGKRPELLLLDEPVANLDPVARLDLLEELMGAVAEDGPAVVLSSNVLSDVERVCEHVVILAK